MQQKQPSCVAPIAWGCSWGRSLTRCGWASWGAASMLPYVVGLSWPLHFPEKAEVGTVLPVMPQYRLSLTCVLVCWSSTLPSRVWVVLCCLGVWTLGPEVLEARHVGCCHYSQDSGILNQTCCPNMGLLPFLQRRHLQKRSWQVCIHRFYMDFQYFCTKVTFFPLHILKCELILPLLL